MTMTTAALIAMIVVMVVVVTPLTAPQTSNPAPKVLRALFVAPQTYFWDSEFCVKGAVSTVCGASDVLLGLLTSSVSKVL